MKKTGQFYLFAAIIIIAILIGFASMTNYIKKRGEVKIYDLGDEMGIESGVVLDHGTYNSYNSGEFNALLGNFTITYTEFAGAGKELYFVFGNKNEINVATYSEISTGSISVNLAGQNPIKVNIIKNEYILEKILTGNEDNIKVVIGNNPYEFKLKEGQNFYFVISQEVAGNIYIKTNK